MAIAADKPLDTVRLGIIGIGGRGTGLLETALAVSGVDVRAVCDVIASRAENARRIVKAKTGRQPEAYVKDEFAWRRTPCPRRFGRGHHCHALGVAHADGSGSNAGGKISRGRSARRHHDRRVWQLVHTSEQTGKPCMMLENVCYFPNVLAICA